MHSDIHLTLHDLRADELRTAAARTAAARTAAARTVPRERIRTRLGWALVEVGLRMVHQPTAPGTATARLA
ncbi:hypothetical protein ABZ070_13625 [Streptomyces sp. NPDC006283]|uniref:hypothetical protein n=1 Tax=Streptomyces sp. NPDC006283 TaxID=3156741 RepID=UPI0033A3B09D